MNVPRAWSAFEIALAIRGAEATFASKTSLAEALGLNRTALYNSLAFFKLPAFVLADLETHPGLLGRDAADALASLLASAGEPAHERLQAIWPRVKAGEFEQGKSSARSPPRCKIAARSAPLARSKSSSSAKHKPARSRATGARSPSKFAPPRSLRERGRVRRARGKAVPLKESEGDFFHLRAPSPFVIRLTLGFSTEHPRRRLGLYHPP